MLVWPITALHVFFHDFMMQFLSEICIFGDLGSITPAFFTSQKQLNGNMSMYPNILQLMDGL
jgi:hypothetical protein